MNFGRNQAPAAQQDAAQAAAAAALAAMNAGIVGTKITAKPNAYAGRAERSSFCIWKSKTRV